MKISVLSAHPDDETLGCGASILKWLSEGHEVHWILGGKAIKGLFSDKEINEENTEIKNVLSAYKNLNFHSLAFPTTEFYKQDESQAILKIRKILNDIATDWIFCVDGADVHSDHQHLFNWTWKASKPFRNPDLKLFASYETLSSTEASHQKEFKPNLFINVENFIDKKIEVMRHYQSQLEKDPSPRSESAIRSLARFRGSQSGQMFAEAFTIFHQIL